MWQSGVGAVGVVACGNEKQFHITVMNNSEWRLRRRSITTAVYDILLMNSSGNRYLQATPRSNTVIAERNNRTRLTPIRDGN